ncbi:uncharacterized protein LOC124683969 [Lolium rigidum]|uniref:uncharacterized protein LOC124683969 n=1 Tax=Lolium rigidum TaxID=89674 RepID=UPI001F5D059B|nr:uncharacterized protein LOC124683969 [Lolium rigidum]
MDRLRAEAANAKKKLQADARMKMRWEAAYVELLLGANQKLAELRDSDLDDSSTCAETPNPKLNEVEICAKLRGNSRYDVHITSNISVELRKLKQAYETLSSIKDMENSALLLEKDSMRSQLNIMQQDYAALLKNKKAEAAQATEAALKLQQSVDELKVLAQKKDDEIGKLQEEAVGAKKQLMKMQSLVKEKDDEIQRLKGWHPQYIQMSNKDINGTHKKLRSDDPCVRGKSKTNVGNYGQDETSQKRRRVSSLSNVQKPLGSPKRKRAACSAQVANRKSHTESRAVKCWYSYRMAPQPLRSRNLKIANGRRSTIGTGHWGNYVRLVNDSLVDQPDKHKMFVQFLCNFENWRICQVARTMEVVLDGQPKLIHQFNRFLPNNCQMEVDDDDEEKQQPEEEQPRPQGAPQPRGQLPSASPSASVAESASESELASAAAGLVKLKEAEQQPKRERV